MKGLWNRLTLKPYYILEPQGGCGGRITGEWYGRSYYCIIRSLPPTVSSTAIYYWSGKPVQGYVERNPYRDLSHSGVTLGLFGQNYWIANDTILGKLLSWL